MRRTSWIAIGIALAGIAVVIAVLSQQDPRSGPRLTKALVESILRRGAAAMNAHDPVAIRDLFTENASVFGEPAHSLESALRPGLARLPDGGLDVAWKNLAITSTGGVMRATFDLVISEKLKNADATYFTSHITLEFERASRPGPLNIIQKRLWLISRATSTTNLALPKADDG